MSERSVPKKSTPSKLRYLSLAEGSSALTYRGPFTLRRGSETVAVAPDLAGAANALLVEADLNPEGLEVRDSSGQRVQWGAPNNA
jgi:hypothetical protein